MFSSPTGPYFQTGCRAAVPVEGHRECLARGGREVLEPPGVPAVEHLHHAVGPGVEHRLDGGGGATASPLGVTHGCSGPATSASAPASEMTNGVREDIASAATSPNGSAHCEGKTATSMDEEKSFREIQPGRSTRCCTGASALRMGALSSGGAKRPSPASSRR